MSSTRNKQEGIKDVTGSPDKNDRNEVRDPSVSSGRITRPSTAEVRHEVMRLSKDNSSSEFERGVRTALEWILGDRKTLRRSDK